MFLLRQTKNTLSFIVFAFIVFFSPINLFSQENQLLEESVSTKSSSSNIIYRNPRVYNVDYTFELHPNPDSIDRDKDLKLWIPVPREWDSQKAVKILSVVPEPHATYVDPEHGNKILFWDFGKEPIRDSFIVNIKYRLETFEIHAKVDPDNIGAYDKTSDEYILNTLSTYTLNITPKVSEMAGNVVGNETNPYLKAERIFDFVRKKMRFKFVRHTRGTGISSLLDYPVTDPETGEEYYEGQCDHFSVLFVTLCRAAGIPARGVLGMVGWNPWMTKNDLKLRSKRHKELSLDGLAAARVYGPFGGHIWTEFFIPGYGWIPADPTWGRFGDQVNSKLILTKGHDIMIGPFAPQKESEGYGDQWIPLLEGRANAIGHGVWNIANIRVGKAKYLHTSNPFPADGYSVYAEQLYPEDKAEEKLLNGRKKVLETFYKAGRSSLNKSDMFEIQPRLNASREAYLCHLLRQITGDEKFTKIFQAYLDLRFTSGKPVSTEKFQEIAESIHGASLDFFFEQWLGSKSLPQFKLDKVQIEKGINKWKVKGSLLQEGEPYYRFPIELVLKTEKGLENQEIWMESNQTSFKFNTTDQPFKLIVDPDYNIPTIRWMPPRLQMLWGSYPEFRVIYGSLDEAEANKATAERFIDKFAGLSHDLIKADTDVNEEDLKAKRIILFGRPETNKISQRFQNSFPVKFEKDKFTWQGTTYDLPGQGVAQIVENPLDPQSMIILYAGLSGDATQKICGISEWQKELDGNLLIDYNASFVIFDGYKKLLSGDWEDSDSDQVWHFYSNSP